MKALKLISCTGNLSRNALQEVLGQSKAQIVKALIAGLKGNILKSYPMMGGN